MVKSRGQIGLETNILVSVSVWRIRSHLTPLVYSCLCGAGPTTFLAPQFAYQAAPAGAVPGQMQLTTTPTAGVTVNAVVPVSVPPPMYAAAAAPAPRQPTSVLAPTFGTSPAAYQSFIYWYPSPPVSPQTAPYYVQSAALPTTVLMKGLPPNIQINDVLSFLDGLVEVRTQLPFYARHF